MRPSKKSKRLKPKIKSAARLEEMKKSGLIENVNQTRLASKNYLKFMGKK